MGNPIKLIDFGLSYYNNFNNAQMQILKRGGLSNYIDPESVNSSAFKKTIDYTPNFRSEIYRIGVLIYFILYEKYPHDSFSWKCLCKKIKEKPIYFVSRTPKDELIPSDLLYIMEKSLNKEPHLRFSSAMEIEN